MKKLIFGIVFCFLSSVIVLGQDSDLDAQTPPRHWISASPGLRIGGSSWAWPAADLRYEFMVNPYFSVDAYVYYEFTYGIGIAGRWYPTSRSFFAELGFGYNKWYGYNVYLDHESDIWHRYLEDYNAIDIILGSGWRIDIGKHGGFYITPMIKYHTLLRWYKNHPFRPDAGPSILPNLIGYFGLGYAF